MGRNSELKTIRKQIRTVVRENMDTILAGEVLTTTTKTLAEGINTRMDEIGKNVDTEVKKMDTQTQTFRGYMMRELGMQLTDELANISATMMAWQEVLTKRMGITDMTAFDAEVAAAKVEIQNRLQAEAQLKADAEAAASLKAREDAKAAEALKAEQDAKTLAQDAPVQEALASKESEPAQG